jgi:hypothetical protein
MTSTTYEIHPGIGIARVGTSTTDFFVGPEPDENPPELYRDKHGELKRQAARFRVYECERDERNILVSAREVTPDLGTIVWTVHLANRKAAGEVFPRRSPKRPRNELDPDRDGLRIDPGPRSVDEANTVALFDTGTFRQEAVPLGEIRIDDKSPGRLIVLGGFGKSESVPDGTPVGGPDGKNFANNDNWYDDVSDGPVRAVVTTVDGETHQAKPSWVIVAPPDFAPEIPNFVTMYDIARDVAVGKKWFALPDKPSFTRDILPILSRPFGYRWVNRPAAAGHGPGGRGDFSGRFAQLADPAGDARKRDDILAKLRDPSGIRPVDDFPMPRLHDQTNSDKAVLPASRTQYAILQKWVDGTFVGDFGQNQIPAELLPDALDRVALQGCSGGAFFPGIEAGAIMTDPDRYIEPYRLDADSLVPGQMTEGNALPWQADFYLCAFDGLGWWPAQRPDDVYTDLASVTSGDQKPWVRGIADMPDMAARWHTLGIVVERPGTGGHSVFLETERQLPED